MKKIYIEVKQGMTAEELAKDLDIHVDIVLFLAEKGLIRHVTRWWLKQPTEFVTLQRDGNTNNMLLGESN